MTAREFRMKLWGLILLLVFVTSPMTVLANSKPVFYFKKVDVEQKLGRSRVLKVTQDHEGFIWAATQDGLYRYDGYQLKAFRHNPDDPHSLPGNYIVNLFVDSHGTLWIASTQGGIARYSPQSERFERFHHSRKSDDSISSNMVFALAEDKEGFIWAATYGGGLNRFDTHSGKFKHFLHDPKDIYSLADDKVTTVITTMNDEVWLGTQDKGVIRFDKKSGHFREVRYLAKGKPANKRNHTLALLEDSKGTIWMSTNAGGLARYNRKTNAFEPLALTDDNGNTLDSHTIYDLVEDDLGAIWLASRYGGLLRLDSATGQLLNYRHDPLNSNSVSGNNIFSLTKDASGMIWVSLFNDGLNKFDPTAERFGKVIHNPEDPNSINNGDISTMLQDSKGRLWLGSDLGLDLYSPESGKTHHFNHEPRNSNSLSGDDIETVFEDSHGAVWVGTHQSGLNRISPDGSTITQYRQNPDLSDSLPNDAVLSVNEDNQGNIWAGTANGLARLDSHTGRFTQFFHDPADPKSISIDAIYKLSKTRDGEIWIGTSGGGLNHYNASKGTFTRYLHSAEDSNSLSNNWVYDIYEDQSGILWVGTAGGLNRFDRSTKQFKHYREKDGLANDAVFNITEDSKGNLWLGLGEKSIAWFDVKSHQIRNGIGLEADCAANQGAMYKSKDGKLFVGSRGYCAFYPEKVLRHSRPPKLALTDFYILHKPVKIDLENHDSILTRAINHTDKIELSYMDNVLSFEFAALHFAAPERNRYRYRLKGFDRDWITTNAQLRRATYTNLQPGNYVFEVEASNHEGIWTHRPRRVSLVIDPAPWRTWWAYLIYLCIIGGIIGSITHQRNLKRKALILAKNNAELARVNAEKANKAKTLFVADISHEIRTPLNAVIGYTQMLEQDPSLTEQHKQKVSIIEKSGNHLLGLINNILDISKIEADAMTLNNEDFELIDMLRGIIFMLAIRGEEKGLSLTFDNQLQDIIEVNGDQGKLRQVLINLLANAVKFTDKGKVTLTLTSRQPNHYCFEVSDSGPGIAKEHHKKIFEEFGQTDEGIKKGGTGLGLAIAYKQVALMGGLLEVASELGKGSRFFFTLPMKEAEKPRLLNQQQTFQYAHLDEGCHVNALIVEDSRESRELLQMLLDNIGVTVTSCTNGEEALCHLQPPPDIIFIDIKMPQMDGLSLLTQLKRLMPDERPKCVAISAHAMPEDVERFTQAGFDAYVTKPYKFDSIYQSIALLPGVSLTTIESQSDEPEDSVDARSLKIPVKYLNRLKSVAADYEITLVEECLAELAGESSQGAQLAELAQPFLTSYDMDGLLEILEQVESSSDSH